MAEVYGSLRFGNYMKKHKSRIVSLGLSVREVTAFNLLLVPISYDLLVFCRVRFTRQSHGLNAADDMKHTDILYISILSFALVFNNSYSPIALLLYSIHYNQFFPALPLAFLRTRTSIRL